MTSSTRQRYPEKRLQLGAIDWLKGNRGYVELFSDAEATGSRVDSVGTLDGRLMLIEVKLSINASIVDHALDRAQSLESKISGALRSLYGAANDGFATIARPHWDRLRPPVVAFLAGTYSEDGWGALRQMLERRSIEWRFDYRVWQWNGREVVERSTFDQSAADPACWQTIDVPALVGRTKRTPARSEVELLALATERGVGELLQGLIELARQNGFDVQRGVSSLNFRRKPAHKQGPVVGVYLDASDAGNGINVGCWREAVGVAEDALPGRPAPPAGFLNTNRYLQTRDQVEALIRLFV